MRKCYKAAHKNLRALRPHLRSRSLYLRYSISTLTVTRNSPVQLAGLLGELLNSPLALGSLTRHLTSAPRFPTIYPFSILWFPAIVAYGMAKAYVEERDGGYWVSGTRISLDSIVAAFNRGAAPETIRRSFPLLSLEEVYGAITFYLARESQIDQYLLQSNTDVDALASARHEQLRASKLELYDRVLRARQETKSPQR